MSDQDLKDTQDRTEEQNEGTKNEQPTKRRGIRIDGGTKNRKNSEDDQETTKKGSKGEETKTKDEPQRKQNTEQDTQTDTARSNGKDSQTDTESPMDSKGTEEGKEGNGTKEYLPNGSDTKSVSEDGDSREIGVSKQVDQFVGDGEDNAVETNEEGNVVLNGQTQNGHVEDITETGQNGNVSEQRESEMQQNINGMSEMVDTQQSGNDVYVSDRDEKTDESITQADDTGQEVVLEKETKQVAEDGDNLKHDDNDHDDDDDDNESGDDESGSDESASDDEETKTETDRPQNSMKEVDQSQPNQESSIKTGEETASQSQELKTNQQSNEATDEEERKISQESNTAIIIAESSVQGDTKETGDNDASGGKVHVHDQSNDYETLKQGKVESVSSDHTNGQECVFEETAETEPLGQEQQFGSGSRDSPNSSEIVEVTNVVEDNEHRKSPEQVGVTSDEGRGTPNDSITDKNGEEEFESSSISQSEHDVGSMGGQPPISTVYVKPQRKQSESESQLSVTGQSQDEIDMVSMANREAEEEKTPHEEQEGEVSADVHDMEELEAVSAEIQDKEEVEEGPDEVQDKEDVEEGLTDVQDKNKVEEGLAEVQDKDEVEEVSAEVQEKDQVGEVSTEEQDKDEVNGVSAEEQGMEKAIQNIENEDEVQDAEQADILESGQNLNDEVIKDKDGDQVMVEDNLDVGGEGRDLDEVDHGKTGEDGNTDESDKEKGEVEVDVLQEEVKDEGEKKVIEGEKKVEEESESEDEDDDDDDDETDDDEESEEDEAKKENKPESVSDTKNISEETTEQTHVDVQEVVEEKEGHAASQADENNVEEERGQNDRGGERKTSTISHRSTTLTTETKQHDEEKVDTLSVTKDVSQYGSKASVGQEEDTKSVKSTQSYQSRGRVSASRESLKASKVSLEKQEQAVVQEDSVDAAQSPVFPPREESKEAAREAGDYRGSIHEDESKKAKSRASSSSSFSSSSLSSSSSDKSDIKSSPSKADSQGRAQSKTSVKGDSIETENGKSKENSQTKEEYESAKGEECEQKTQEPKPVSRGRTTFKSPRKSSGSPQRRGQISSARRSPRPKSMSQTRSPSRPRTTNTMRSYRSKEADGRAKQKEFFKEELKRLEDSLKREKSRIIRPVVKKHTPYIFNTLEPYYNTSTVRYLLELPDEVEHQFISRRTAIGLCDPWVDYNMDTQFLPRLHGSSTRAINRQQEMDKRDQKIREREKRAKKEGSTMLPKFPVVTMDSKELANKKLNYSDVPLLREELRQKYSQNASRKIDEDYQRTKQDFYRMDLDKLNEVHPINRSHMRSTYFAYLQNTPGSKKAINECVKGMKQEGKAH